MVAVVEMISDMNAAELVRVVWMEVAIASFAAMVYFTLTGWVSPVQKGEKKVHLPIGGGADQEPTTCQMISKAIRQGRLSDAIVLILQLPETCVPATVAPRLLMAVAKAYDFENTLLELAALTGKFEARSLEAVVMEALKNKDMAACRQLQLVATRMSIPKSHRVLEALAKAQASDMEALQSLVDEAEAPLSKSFARAVLEACIAMKDVDLAAEVFEKVAETDAAALREIVEKSATAAVAADAVENAPNASGVFALAKQIRDCGKNSDLSGAANLFEKQRPSTLMYNSVLDACVECGNMQKALHYFALAKSNALADVVSYNTVMKGRLAAGDEAEAARLLGDLKAQGLKATHASYHGLLNARVVARDLNGAWKLVREMEAAGLSPNSVTCSILLKCKLTSRADLSKVIALINAMGQSMDEVLFSSVVEACVRTGQLDLLSKQMANSHFQPSSVPLSAPTYGSMIKAYGQVYDVARIWELWGNMEQHNVQPTAITLGCMVEALVANGCIKDAWQLVQKMRSEECTRPLVNTVIYSTILKGFAKAKETESVMKVYEEMKAGGVLPNTITFNTILNAFAQGGAMNRVPALLDDMKAAVPPVEPDIVTYSTIVKGFCNSGNLDRALKVLEDMQSEGKYAPDEVMYNSLLDGCTREQRADDALKLLDSMKKTGVAPSNYTLSMLAKLMGRCRRLNQAFTLIEEMSREHGLKVNIHVYTCLIQACFMNRQASKAVAVHDKIIQEGLRPDEMTYSVLVKGCLQAGLVDKAVELTKTAYGMGEASSNGSSPGVSAGCLESVVAALGPAGKSLLAELPACSLSKGKGKGKGKGKISSKGEGVAAPWRQGAKA